ncbi:unnamed protein product [Calypogeia fissa]
MASTSTSISNSSVTEFEKCNNSISLCHKPVCDPTAEIIFFHDLQWSKHGEPYLQPWMSNGDHSVHWPTCWLSTKFPEARISCACYPGAIWKTETTGHMDLDQITENMRRDIIEIYEKKCPVFLIGHGFGGLIIKRRWRIRSKCRNDAIFATLPTKVDLWDGPWQTWWYGFWHTMWYRYYIQVVEEASMRSDVDGFYSIPSDHFNACRPCDEDDTGFQKLVEFFQPGLPRTSAP